MLRRCLISLAPLLCVLFTACGGGEETPPPQPVSMQNNPQYDQMFQDLYAQAKAAKNSCSNDYQPMFLLLAARFQQQSASGTAPTTPPATTGQPAGSCNNDLMNLMLSFMTIRQPDGQMYAEQTASRQWLARYLAGIVSRIGQGIQGQGININDPRLQQYLLAAGANQVRNVIIPGMGQYAGQASQGFDYFANIM